MLQYLETGATARHTSTPTVGSSLPEKFLFWG